MISYKFVLFTKSPKGTVTNSAHKKYPYLLKGLDITHVNQVWSTDITYIPYKNGFVYLSAIIDWFSRYVLAWSLDIDMEASNCVELLQSVIDQYGVCENIQYGSRFSVYFEPVY